MRYIQYIKKKKDSGKKSPWPQKGPNNELDNFQCYLYVHLAHPASLDKYGLILKWI